MFQKHINVIINNVLNRYLPVTQSVKLGLESEPRLSDFKIIKQLGIGSFGRVLLVQHNKTKVQYALKVLDKGKQMNEQDKENFLREVEIMYKIHHPNIVKLFGHFEDNENCYLLMEYVDKGELFSYIPENGKSKITTREVASIIRDVISAVYYIHHMNPPIMHRDIKPENILITSNMKAKLSDFGYSAYINPGDIRNSICGTPVYLAPEMIKMTGHDEKVDIWSIGVLLFELLTGDQAWAGENVETVKYNICNLRISWPEDMNAFAADLISKILKTNPEERISLRDMLNHSFFTQYFANPTSSLITPDNKKYKAFIISKDNPLTWNPFDTERNSQQQQLKLNPILTSSYMAKTYNQNNYNNLYEKYDNFQIGYNQFQKPGNISSSFNYYKRDTNQKEEEKEDFAIVEKINSNENEFSKNVENSVKWETTSYNLNQIDPYIINFNSQNNQVYLNNNYNNKKNSITNVGFQSNNIQHEKDFDFNNNLLSSNDFVEKQYGNQNEKESKRKKIEQQLYNAFNNDDYQYDSITFEQNSLEDFQEYLF